MPKIFNTLVKWCVRLCVLALGILNWDKTGQACDTATKENRYVGGRTASKLVKQAGPPAGKAATTVLTHAAPAVGQAIGNYAAESLQSGFRAEQKLRTIMKLQFIFYQMKSMLMCNQNLRSMQLV